MTAPRQKPATSPDSCSSPSCSSDCSLRSSGVCPCRPRDNTLSVLGFVFAFVLPPLGTVLSAIGLRQIATRKEGGRGYAIAGLAISITHMTVALLVGLALVTGVKLTHSYPPHYMAPGPYGYSDYFDATTSSAPVHPMYPEPDMNGFYLDGTVFVDPYLEMPYDQMPGAPRG
jgi:hypothetical protein